MIKVNTYALQRGQHYVAFAPMSDGRTVRITEEVAGRFSTLRYRPLDKARAEYRRLRDLDGYRSW